MMAGQAMDTQRQQDKGSEIELNVLQKGPLENDGSRAPSVAPGSEAPTTEVTSPARTESEPPATDSNAHAVIICVACFLLVFTTCGLNFAFGVYQELYETLAEEPDTPFTGASPAIIDLIGTLAVAFQTIASPYAAAWVKLFSPRAVIAVAGILFGLACILASFSQHLWQFELTQGFMLGVGTCLSFMPAVSIAPTWFSKHRALAMGFILSGTGVGGLVMAPAARALISSVGFRNSLRILGSISAAIILAASTVVDFDAATKARLRSEPHNLSRRKRLFRLQLVDVKILKSRQFLFQLLAGALQAGAYYTPVFFFSSYARSLGFTAAQGANFIALNNACNAVGKVVIGYLADRWGRMNTLLLTCAISAAGTFALWLPSAYPIEADGQLSAARGLFIFYSVVYGTFASAYVGLFPACAVELFGPAHFIGVNSVLYLARGLATLVGTPTAGALVIHSRNVVTATARSGSGGEAYRGMILLVGVLLSGATIAVAMSKVELSRASRASTAILSDAQ